MKWSILGVLLLSVAITGLKHSVRDSGFVAYASTSNSAGFTFFSSEFTVPPRPIDQLNNIIYLLPAVLTQSKPGGGNIDACLTFYGSFQAESLNQWSLGVTGQAPIAVNPGDKLLFYFIAVDTSGLWNISTIINGKLNQSAAVSYNKSIPFDICGANVQVYNVFNCQNYPASGFFQVNKIVLKSGNTVVTPVWDQYVTTDQSAQCNLQLSTTPSNISLTWNTSNAPTPTPEPIQYDYSCASSYSDDIYPNSLYGVIRSNPAGTTTYPNNFKCTYGFIAPPGQVVKIQFTSFDLGKNGGGDVVQVYEGVFADPYFPIVFQRTGAGTNTVTTKTRVAYLQFLTDSAGSNAGFVASFTYVSTPSSEGTYTCGPNTTILQALNPTGYVRSNNPNTDSNYFNNVRCSFVITVATSKRVNLDFSRFTLAPGNNDYVQVRDGVDAKAPILLSSSMTLSPLPQITTTGNSAYIYFLSDATGVANGFNAHYKSV